MRHRSLASSFVSVATVAAAIAASSAAYAGDFCFDVTPYEVQHSPSCVVQGDFNGDGWQDLVVANHEVGQESISMLFNNGDGTFAPAVHTTVLGRPYWIGVGDLDADTDLDVVVSGFFGHTVSILLNDGTGALGTPTDIFVGFFPTILTLAKLDADDDLDIAVAVSANATTAVLLNNGDGTFARPVPYPVSLNPYGVTASDFDLDGSLDLAVANYDADVPIVSLLHNNGDGTFSDGGVLAVSDAPVGIASNDLDGNSWPDLVVTIYGATAENDQLEVFLNDGAGGFAAAAPYTVSAGPYWTDLKDVNDDGHADILSANTGIASDGTLAVLLNNGDGTFGAAQFYGAGAAPGCVAVGDLNGDTSPEIVTVSYGDYFVFVLFNEYPVITSDPTGMVVNEGETAQFNVVANGPPPFNYQWRLNGVELFDDGNVSGATSDTLTILAASSADAGFYDVIVTNDCGSLASAAAELVVVVVKCPQNPDIDGDGHVNGADLAMLLGSWGECPRAEPGECCVADLNGDGFVGGADIALVLGNWAP